MELGKEIRGLASPVVIVDDMYRAPELVDAVSQKQVELLRALKADKKGVASVRQVLGGKRLTAQHIVGRLSRGEGLDDIWSAYEADRDGYKCLDVVFYPIYVKRNKELKGLQAIDDFCMSLTGRRAIKHATLESARNDLRSCAIAFVDFRLRDEALQDSEFVDSHEAFKDDYQHPFTVGGAMWPKIMVLISSKPPGRNNLARFREVTGVRSAFFSSMRKGEVTEATLQKAFKSWSSTYPAAAELNSYLTATEKAVQDVASSLQTDIRRLEVHDLALLQVLRLAAEQETLQSYVTWLVAESMAARLRANPALGKVKLGPKAAEAALDGKLLTGSVLFEMFADVASSAIPVDSNLGQGDVFVVVEEDGRPSTSKVTVAISPACDLLRCTLDYDVLCVRGTLIDSGTDLQKLIDRSKGLFGKGHHVMRVSGSGKPRFMRITWDEKGGLHSVKARDLRDAKKYQRRSRLSESFAQEIKELALSHASRIGVPMDPAFAVWATVMVRMTSKRDKDSDPVTKMHDLGQDDFSPVVVSVQKVVGQVARDVTATFTTHFMEWLDGFLDDFQTLCGEWVPPELARIRQYLESGALRVAVKDGGAVSGADGAVSIHFNAEFPDVGAKGKLEIFVSTVVEGSEGGG